MDTEVKAQVELEQEHEPESHPEDTFLELGSVSKDTRSFWTGGWQDGGWGFWWP